MRKLINFFRYDCAIAWRNLTALPGFFVTVIITLASTLGAVTLAVNINVKLLAKPLPYPNAERLWVTEQSETINGDTQYGFQILPAQHHIYKDKQFIEEMALIVANTGRLRDIANAPFVFGRRVSPEFFSLLKVPMLHGRGLTMAEGVEQKNPAIVLSYDTWKTHFKQDVGVIGQHTLIDEQRYKIVGVTHPDFEAPQLMSNQVSDFWSSFANTDRLTNWGSITTGITGIAKLKVGADINQVNTMLGQQINGLYQSNDLVAPNTAIGAAFVPLKDRIIGRSKPMALLLLAAVAVLLLIAVTNLTNLFLSRAAQQQRTMAIQAALGAQPSALFRSMFAEALIPAALACGLGLIFAGWMMHWLSHDLTLLFTRIYDFNLDPMTLLAGVLISLLIAVVVALAASKKINYETLNGQLQSSGKGVGGQISQLTRNILVATQVALTTTVLIAAVSLLTPSIAKLTQETGMTLKNNYYVSINGGSEEYDAQQLANDITSAIVQYPGVQQVSSAGTRPTDVGWEEYLYDANQQMLGIFSIGYFSDSTFDILGIPFISGRTFSEGQLRGDPRAEIIISESLATRLYGDLSAIGKTLFTRPGEPLQVVGVVSDIRVPTRLPDYKLERYYVPFGAGTRNTFVVNSTSVLTARALTPVLQKVDGSLTVREAQSIAQRLARSLQQDWLLAILVTGLMILALSLAIAGIYGVLNFSVQMRQRELGIHLSLGAHTGAIIRLVIQQSLWPIFIGLMFGIACSVIGYLTIVKLTDLALANNYLFSGLMIVLMVAAAVLASYLPVRQLVARDPLRALREN